VFTALNKMLAMSSDVILPTQVQYNDWLWSGRFKVLTAVSPKIQVFCYIMQCCWVSGSWDLEGTQFLQNTGNYLSVDTESHHKRLWSSNYDFILFLKRCDADIFWNSI
jgi:hypothetical protein